MATAKLKYGAIDFREWFFVEKITEKNAERFQKKIEGSIKKILKDHLLHEKHFLRPASKAVYREMKKEGCTINLDGGYKGEGTYISLSLPLSGDILQDPHFLISTKEFLKDCLFNCDEETLIVLHQEIEKFLIQSKKSLEK